jgi:hypothetical protein
MYLQNAEDFQRPNIWIYEVEESKECAYVASQIRKECAVYLAGSREHNSRHCLKTALKEDVDIGQPEGKQKVSHW